MNVAFSTWNARIAPVFDTARELRVLEVESGVVIGRVEVTLPDGLLVERARRLADLGVTTLVCGAISWPLHSMVTALGIGVVPFVSGTLGEVERSWLAGTLRRQAFGMPGCRRRRRARRGCGSRHWRGNHL
jgi:predicted Fe-Mo cluster-binding NifX family protein